ncbi:MAG TPA: dipeptide epimerase [Xanthomonadales bacterium]|nr:dipeptide epimerase [Xanthomonadales bacterium]
MKISRVDVFKLNIELTVPAVVPIGILDAATNVIIRLETDTGLKGWGEASPFAPITGDTQESNFLKARPMGELLLGKDPLPTAQRMDELTSLTRGEPSLRSAFDMALYDLLGQATGLPLFRLLGGERRTLITDRTIGLKVSVEETVRAVQEILDLGFTEVKLKVGRPHLEDVEHVKAVRQLAGPDLVIRIDSNQGWDYPTALASLRAMSGLNIQYSEQPLPAADYEGLRRLKKNSTIPICADESLFTARDALKLVCDDGVDYLNIKLGKSGGIGMALEIEAIARAAGRKCMLGCFAETRLGLTAAAHLACARQNIAFLDLDSAYMLCSDPVLGGLHYSEVTAGLIHLTDDPGLGATIAEDQLRKGEHYTLQES